MSLTSEGMSVADFAAITGNNGNRGYGMDNDLWILILFFCLFGNGNWGNNGWNGNGNNGGAPYVVADVQRGFDQNAVMNGIGNLQNSVVSGFGDVQLGIAGVNQSICQTGNGIMGAVNNGFSQAEIAANARQIANMQQDFNSQTALMGQLNNMSMAQQNCCCENRAAIADLRYTVGTEACADRAAIGDALQAVTAQGVANTNALMNTINGGIQALKDQLCQDKIDAKNEEIANLRQQVNMQNLAASQAAQTAQLIADNTAQTQYVVNRIAPYPQPSYIVPNPNGGCGCGQGFMTA